MKTRRRWLFAAILIGIPLLAVALWLGSGREVLTKPQRAVDVQITDKLFGDTIVETKFVRGPVFGYYVGLDLVIVATGACMAIGGISWIVGHRRARRKESV